MNFMSVNLPYPTSSLVDVLSILEAVGEPIKIKKIVKELLEASEKFTEAKNSYHEKGEDLQKKINKLNEKEIKLEASELKLNNLKASSLIEVAALKKLESEILSMKSEIEEMDKSFQSKKAEQIAIITAKENAASLRFNEVDNLKVEANALIKEYQEKLAKLKAVML